MAKWFLCLSFSQIDHTNYTLAVCTYRSNFEVRRYTKPTVGITNTWYNYFKRLVRYAEKQLKFQIK